MTSHFINKTCFFGFIIFLYSCLCSAEGVSVSIDEASIREQRALSNQAIVGRDIELFISTLTQDYHVVTSANLRLSGHDEQRDMMQKLYADYPDVSYVRTPTVIDINNDLDFAAETGTWVGSLTREGKKVDMHGSYFSRWVKLEGAWLIQAEVFVPL